MNFSILNGTTSGDVLYTESFSMDNTTSVYMNKTSFCYYEKKFELNSYGHEAQPNIALLSLSLCIGTCAIALALKKLRLSNFFSSYVS